MAFPLLARARIASPCSARWDSMTGDDRVRFCASCEKHVYNLPAMPAEDAERLLAERTGSICVRLHRAGTRRKRVKLTVAAAGAAAAIVTTTLMAGCKQAPRETTTTDSAAVAPSSPPAPPPSPPPSPIAPVPATSCVAVAPEPRPPAPRRPAPPRPRPPEKRDPFAGLGRL